MQTNTQNDLFYNKIIQDIGEGILTLGLDGRIGMLNPAGEAILGVSKEQITGQKFSAVFFQYPENDLFNQMILDAVYDSSSKHEKLVPYFDGEKAKHLHVMTSFLHEDKEKIGIIAVIRDVSEIVEMEQRHYREINTLIESIVKTLSVAIDERSHYTAKHTKNMVSMGEAFLDWLKETNNPWQFDEDKRRELLMSIWLHDIGKIAIPLEIMDKATRLGPRLELIEARFSRIALIERIALLEGQITQAEYSKRTDERTAVFAFIKQLNNKGFVSDEDLVKVQELRTLRYSEEDGREVPLFTPDEIEDLSIRKGTLTSGERQIMQSHAALTRKILDQVSFPPVYSDIPLWASSHHELRNGKGYPDKKVGDEIPKEVRFITILDIFEALTAKDRPYKPPIPLEKAWDILDGMVKDGSISAELLKLFRESGAWQALFPAAEEKDC